MGFFDNIQSSFNRGTATMRLKSQLEDANKRRQNLAAQLGASLYDATREMPELRTGREALYDGIAQLDAQRVSLQAEISRVEAESQAAANASATVDCPFCSSKVGVNDMFCMGCGKPMAEIRAAIQVPAAGTPTVAGTPAVTASPAAGGETCPTCGAPVSADDVFCMSCGHKIDHAQASAAPAEPESTADGSEAAAEPAQAAAGEPAVAAAPTAVAAPAAVAEPTAVAEPAAAVPATCSSCGAPIADDDVFCMTCGKRIERAAAGNDAEAGAGEAPEDESEPEPETVAQPTAAAQPTVAAEPEVPAVAEKPKVEAAAEPAPAVVAQAVAAAADNLAVSALPDTPGLPETMPAFRMTSIKAAIMDEPEDDEDDWGASPSTEELVAASVQVTEAEQLADPEPASDPEPTAVLPTVPTAAAEPVSVPAAEPASDLEFAKEEEEASFDATPEAVFVPAAKAPLKTITVEPIAVAPIDSAPTAPKSSTVAPMHAASTPAAPAPAAPMPAASLPSDTCPACNALISAGDKFCMHCGSPLGARPVAAQPSLSSCPKCGTVGKSTDKFCRGCGFKLI